jgi:hypothetical protein
MISRGPLLKVAMARLGRSGRPKPSMDAGCRSRNATRIDFCRLWASSSAKGT